MDNLRLILLFSLAFIALMLYEAWNEDYGQKPALQPDPVSTDVLPGVDVPVPAATSAAVPSAPAVPSAASQQGAAVPGMTAAAESGSRKIVVTTDLYTLELDTVGGNINKLFLNDYPVSLEEQDRKFQLMKPTTPDLYIVQSGLIGSEEGDAPTHESVYRIEKASYSMEDDDSTLQVDMHWKGSNGLEVTKRYIFTRGSYLVTVQHLVKNASGKSWAGREYRQLMHGTPAEKSGGSQFIYTFTGGAIYSPEDKYEKISFDDMDDETLSRDVKGGWIAMLQHYFLGAWVPPVESVEHFYSNVLPGNRYVLGAYTEPVSIEDGAGHTFSSGFVAGPKLQDKLEAIAPGLDLTADYGWLTVLAKPIFWMMKHIHAVIGNWGFTIILLTLMIKIVFFKLSETSYKSMANMRRMTPRIQALKDRYGDDKKRLNQAMMEMYKKEKINPLGGCLPIVVQIPVFIALYWVLLESVELRQAPFILWIQDLSIKDPFFVLPVIMGVSMFIQQKLNPAPPDPMQAKIMMSLPFVFTIFFAFFPSGLVLYWVTNNILSISQQWYITRQIEKQAGS